MDEKDEVFTIENDGVTLHITRQTNGFVFELSEKLFNEERKYNNIAIMLRPSYTEDVSDWLISKRPSREPVDRDGFCPECNGSGKVPNPYTWRDSHRDIRCPECDGTGKVNLPGEPEKEAE